MARQLFGWRLSRAAEPDGGGTPRAFALPKSFEWYLEGAKWLIAIAAGMLAFSLQTIKDAPRGMPFAVFLVAALFLIVMIGVGIWYLWTSYFYAALREGGRPRDDATVKVFKARSDRLFTATVLSFAAGMILFVAFHAVFLLVPPSKDPPPLQVHAAGGATIAQRGDRLWVMTTKSDGTVAWRPIAPPK